MIKGLSRKGFHWNGVHYKSSIVIDSISNTMSCDEDIEANFEAAHALFLEKKYGTSTPNHLIIKGYSSFYDLFRSEQFIEKLYQNVKDNLKQISSKTDYLSSLQSIEEQLNKLQGDIIDFSKRVPVYLKFWRELILGKIKLLIDDLRGETSAKQSQRMRAFILKSLIEASEFEPKTQKNVESFIADILGSTSDAVGAYFNDFNKENFGMKKKEGFVEQIEKALATCNKLGGKSKIQNDSYNSLLQKVSKGGKEDVTTTSKE